LDSFVEAEETKLAEKQRQLKKQSLMTKLKNTLIGILAFAGVGTASYVAYEQLTNNKEQSEADFDYKKIGLTDEQWSGLDSLQRQNLRKADDSTTIVALLRDYGLRTNNPSDQSSTSSGTNKSKNTENSPENPVTPNPEEKTPENPKPKNQTQNTTTTAEETINLDELLVSNADDDVKKAQDELKAVVKKNAELTVWLAGEKENLIDAAKKYKLAGGDFNEIPNWKSLCKKLNITEDDLK
jgi:hypothetical protein